MAGGRDFNDYQRLSKVMDHVLSQRDNDEVEIVSGGARGADSLGERYAKDNNLKLKIFPADWDSHGKAAGHIRNKQMAEYATHLVLFWDGKSKGSANMLETAKKIGLIYRVMRY